VAFRGTAAALLILLAACSGSENDHEDDVVFRVGATAGMSELVPSPKIQGSSAAAVDLVFDFADSHVENPRVEGNKVYLTRRTNSPHTAEQLAASLRSQGLLSARALGPDRIEAVFGDQVSARSSIQPWGLAFDVGPFRIESHEPGKVRLRRRGNSGIDVIEIVELSSSDEWRKLLARELDVMSFSPSLYRDQFDGMDSVHVIDIPATTSAALYFNVRAPALADANVRRQIASGLNRRAIARIATGDASSAAAPVVGVPDAEITMPSRLALIVVEADSTMLLAASVVRHELDRLSIRIDVEPVALEEFLSASAQSRHDMVLLPLPNGQRRYSRFLSPAPDSPSNTGFADPEYDAAVERGDYVRAQAILDREMPATVLYARPAFAAIDSRFCGNVTPSDTSWRWMADLHLCKNGEGEGNATP
jgi:Bacterial extracellular solute-binding proteins, family 5 Middle